MADSSSFMPPSIPKFDGFYDHWAELMENLLRSKEYWSLIENGIIVASANATQEQIKAADESRLKDLKVKNYLFQSIDRSILEMILERNTSRDIWESMRRKYQGSNKVKQAQLQSLRRDFEVLCMKEDESVNDFFARTLAIANKMTAHGERLTESKIVEKILSLLVHEGRMKIHKAKDEEQALKEENANFAAEFNEYEEILMMAQQQTCNNTSDQVWFLDSGCSNHMIGTKEWLFDFDEKFRETVKLGDNSTMQVMGKGNVKLYLAGKISIITDVYYHPELKNNLLSIGQLQQKNLTIVFSKDVCKIFHEEKGLIVSTEMTVNRMYILLAPVMIPTCFQIVKKDDEYLWHCRYGHLSFKGLHALAKRDMVKGLPIMKDNQELCSDCVVSKQHRDSIPKSTSWIASAKLELIHSDICGPINPSSNGGCRYFITFTDDFSRKTWSSPLKEKSSAFEIFKRFKALVEKESNNQIKCFRTDRGGEFTLSNFNDFCTEHGIKRQLTVAYTPQQNGVSERKNRTLMNMVRSMLTGKCVPKRFWPEAVVWATYVINRSPTLSVKDMTPEEAWSNVKPSVSYFKVFGCIGYVHIPDAQRKKLDPKGIKCVHLGISEESKAYKLYDPAQKKIIISRDVIFDESQGWNWEEKNKTQIVQLDEATSSEPAVEVEDQGVIIEDNNEEEPIHSEGSDYEDNNDNTTETLPTLPPRTRKPPGWVRDYVTNLEDSDMEQLQNLAVFCNNDDPNSYEEASKFAMWRQAMDQEIESIEKNETWELVSLPRGVKKIGVKWIYKTKYKEQGKVEKYKARLVAKGYAQQYGIDFNEVFAPVARWDTIRAILAVAAS
ncbi:retrovirus-related pol polyprotein from transposon tnt 1-94, partial [Trifolium medium]|nr:retrovirus-related pol polyprotein from transposon tnt 1-94 [Trifolium medium]